MTFLIVSVHVIVCLVLILVILLQAGRGAGLSWGSFGGTPQSIFGTKSATFLAKATSVCAVVFLLTCIALNIMETRKSRSLFTQAKSSQVDLEKIKQALEQVKQKTPTTGTKSESSAATGAQAVTTEPTPPAPPSAPAAAQPIQPAPSAPEKK